MNVRGSVLEARVRYMKAQGMKPYARFLTSLSPGLRETVERGVRPEAFYPAEHFLEVLDVIEAQLGEGDERFCYALGKACCDLNLGTFHRFFLRIGSIHKALDRAQAAWRVHYDDGELLVLERSESSVRLKLAGMPFCHLGFARSVKGWIVRMGEHTGEAMQPLDDEDEVLRQADDGTWEIEMGFAW